MSDIIGKVHWLAFTVHAPIDEAFAVYDYLFKFDFGPLCSLYHGDRSFREIYYNKMVTAQGVVVEKGGR